MKDFLIDHSGRKCKIDNDNPMVVLNGHGGDRNYLRGSVVYPIARKPEDKPGTHDVEGYVIVTTPYTDTANFVGLELGKEVVSLRDLVETAGTELGISYGTKGFSKKGEKIDTSSTINALIEQYLTLRVPEDVRNGPLSRRVKSELDSYESGIIFDDIREVAAALILYDMGIVSSSGATRDKLIEDMWRSSGKGGVDDPSLMRNIPSARLIDIGNLISNARGHVMKSLINGVLNSGGKYRRDYDYDGMGSAFFKTLVEVDKVDEKYVLGLHAAYVGDKPEKELAAALRRERSLVRTGSRHELSNIGGWAGIDMNTIFAGGALSKDEIYVLARAAANETSSENYSVEIDKTLFDIHTRLTQEENYRPDVVRAGGNKVFLKSEGDGALLFSLTLNPHDADKIVTTEGKTKATSTAQYFKGLIDSNLSR